jgi:eukaryotic-like serine/threonine-protein kinase
MKPERWRHIDKLLGEALELEVSQRAAFLDQACADDEELRRKIDALLAAHEQAENFIEAPAFGEAAQALADEARSMVGRQLGHYQVSALLGAGGMGAVWKAKDTRLGRDVAIKTLSIELDQHSDRLARFEREAKLLASLNHPNIAAIHGLDEDRGTRFLVLELVEGDTLAERLRHGAIPLHESLKLARQISEALEAAHEKGIIHRDLKPANIKITGDGTVKVLDFGLAKAFAEDEVHADPSDSPALSIESTEQGMILGTAAYMAPEQARGRKVDRRADIWAFGVVLYEMVTGTRLFQGADPTDTIASVVMKEPDLDQAPAPVRRLLRKCLEKDPKNRLRDIADAWELLNDPLVAADAPHPQARRREPTLPWIMASVLGIVAIVFSFLWLKPLPLPEVARLQIYAPPGGRLPLGTPAISNDGRTLAYTVVDPDGVTRIHVRAIDGVESRALPGTEWAAHPFWSPRGDSLAFVARLMLKRIDLAGESVRDLHGTSAPWQGSWNKNGDILMRAGQGLVRISEQGASIPIPNSSDLAFPAFLTDGHRFLVRVLSDKGNSIQLGALGSTERTLVVDNVLSAPVLAPTPRGKTYLLFLRESNLMAQGFDEASGKVFGNPVLLAPRIGQVANPAVMPTVGVSPSGILTYQNADQVTTRRLRWVDRSGLPLRTLSADLLVGGPRLSPDQSSVAGVRSGDIWMTDLVRESSERKTFDDVLENSVVWSEDGSRLAFLRWKSGIYTIDVKGDGKPKLLTETQGAPTSWSGQRLLYTLPPALQSKIYLLDVANVKKPIQVGSPNGGSGSGEFSPDGKYIAFHSDKSGRPEVYVQPIPPGAGETRVSVNGGGVPRWRGDGKEIFFVNPDGDLMAVDIKLGGAISVGTPHKLFRFDSRDGYEVARNGGYDVARDGQRFLFVSPVEEFNSPITVVLNWWVELEKRLGR